MHHTNTLFCSHHRFIWVFCLETRGSRLERATSSPNSIAKEILSRLEEMEQQQGGNWTLEEIKGALIDDIRVMIQDELRQALTGLMPPSPAATIPIAPTIPSTANASSTPAFPTAFTIPHAVFVLPTATLTNDSGGKPSNSIKVVPIMQIKKKNVRKARKKRYQTEGTQQGSTSQAEKVHAVQQPRRFSNFNQSRSTVLNRLIQKGLLRPLTISKPPNPNLPSFNPKSYCIFHQVVGHSTDSCMRLKHEI